MTTRHLRCCDILDALCFALVIAYYVGLPNENIFGLNNVYDDTHTISFIAYLMDIIRNAKILFIYQSNYNRQHTRHDILG